MRVRTSIVLSVGDDLHGLAVSVERAVRLRWPMLSLVVAHVHVRSNGVVVRLFDGREDVLAELDGLSTVVEPGVNPYKRNFELLVGDLRPQQEVFLHAMSRDVRRSDRLLRLMSEHEWRDAGGLFLHVLAPSFGPLSSVLPLSLIEILAKDAGRIVRGVQISSSILYLLPGLFEAGTTGQDTDELARSHATLSELEVALHPQRKDVLIPECRAWVLGSLDRRGGVSDLRAVIEMATQFVMCQIDGTLETREGWANELARVVDSRRTFLSSFGMASLGFPRESLRRLGIAAGTQQLQAHLARAVDPEEDPVPADVQGWIEDSGLPKIVQQLPGLVGSHAAQTSVTRQSGPNRGLAEIAEAEDVRLPDMPEVRDTLTASEWDNEVVKRTGTETDVAWGGIVQRAGDALFREYRERVRQELERRLGKRRSSIEHCRVFCEHLVGTGKGLTDALVGADVRNLESLVLDVQSWFAQEAGFEGDPKKLRKLKVLMIPGKQEAIESAEDKIAGDRLLLAKLKLLPENQSEQEESEPLRDIRKRIRASEGDVEKYRAELAELRDECDRQERLVTEQRRLACDPVRRHLLLARLRDNGTKRQKEHKEPLDLAVKKRDEAQREFDGLDEIFHQKWQRIRPLLSAIAAGTIAGVVLVMFGIGLDVPPAWQWVLFVFLTALVVIGGIVLMRQWKLRRGARSKLLQARNNVTDEARKHWDRQVRDLEKRFAFLVHAEANRVLERIRSEVMEEGIRLVQIREHIREFSSSVDSDAAEAEAGFRGEANDASVLSFKRARHLIVGHKPLARQLDFIAESVLPSDLVRAVRTKGLGAGFQSVVARAEEAIGEAVEGALETEGLATVIERAVAAGEVDDIARRWRGVQYAAPAQIALKPEGPTRTERRIFFVPDGSSDTVKRFLEGALEDEPPIWQIGRPDSIDVCEVSAGFPSWQVAELAMPKHVLDQRWRQVEAVEGTRQLSLPSHEVLVSVDDGDAYAVLQAAIAYLLDQADESSASSRTPAEWLRQFEKAEEYPAASPADLVAEMLIRAGESESGLEAFSGGLPIRHRRVLDFLVEEHGSSVP